MTCIRVGFNGAGQDGITEREDGLSDPDSLDREADLPRSLMQKKTAVSSKAL